MDRDLSEEVSSANRISIPETRRIVTAFAQRNYVSETTALIAITHLVQDGCTNSSKPNLKRNVRGKVFDLQDLRQVILLICKTGTVGKLAKSLRAEIAHISLLNGFMGPLFKDLKRAEPNLVINGADAIFCCEIYSDNYSANVPAHLQETLQRREVHI